MPCHFFCCEVAKVNFQIPGTSLQRLLTPDKASFERQISVDTSQSPKTQEERRLSYEGENRFWRRLGGFLDMLKWATCSDRFGMVLNPEFETRKNIWHCQTIGAVFGPVLVLRQGEYVGGSRLRLLRQDALTRWAFWRFRRCRIVF